jgi:uncharacterized protein YcbK (DUF882 family)
MGRDQQYPPTREQLYNLLDLLPRLNFIRFKYGKPMKVTSGYRPGAFNVAAGGAKQSAHLTLQACDFADPDGALAAWCLSNMSVLITAGLYLEDPSHTKGWVHLQSRPTNNNPFKITRQEAR